MEASLIGARFVCKLADNEKALMEVVHPYLNDPTKRNIICCRIVEGSIRGDDGKVNGPGTFGDLPLERVVAAIERYRAKKEPAALASE